MATLAIKLFCYIALNGLRSPLQLRDSLHLLSREHPRPHIALLRHFLPYPTWHFSLPEPLPPHEILCNVNLMLDRRRAQDLPAALTIPVWRARDTPLRCLYRMCESVMAGDVAPAATETEYFFYQAHWALDAIPDPNDSDPVRYAVFASLVEELVRAFNWRLSRGRRRDHLHVVRKKGSEVYPAYETVMGPGWTRGVAPVGSDDVALMPVEVVRDGGVLVLDGEGGSEVFARRNVVVGVRWMYEVPGMKGPSDADLRAMGE